MAKQRITIADVTRVAKVSQPTVSHVLRGTWANIGITEATRDRVMEAVEALGYRPNRLASGLAARKTRIVGLVLPDYSAGWFDPYISSVSSSVVETLSSNDYRCVIEYGNRAFYEKEKYLELYEERLVDGLIFVGLMCSDQEILSKLAREGRPYILINSSDENNFGSEILEDSIGNINLALGHLREIGCQDICYVTEPKSITLHMDRLKAVEAAFEKSDPSFKSKRIVCTNDIAEGEFERFYKEAMTHKIISRSHFPDSIIPGYVAARSICKSGNIPDGVFAVNDWVALGLILGFKDEGLCVPEDVSVIGSDDSIWSSYVEPAITTIGIHAKEMGQQAGSLAMKIFGSKSEKASDHKFSIPCELIVRESCRNLGQTEEGA